MLKQIAPREEGFTGYAERQLMSVCNKQKIEKILKCMLDENEFLGPYGIRSLSRYHLEHPFVFQVGGQEYKVQYLPAESNTAMFGGNSNWRGPVWMPVKILRVGFILLFPGNLPGLAVSAVLTHIRLAYIFFPVAIVCNAITWLTTCAVWRVFHGQVTRRTQRYGVAFFVTIWGFGVVNTLHFLRPVTCSDCSFPYGVPFTLYRNSGNASSGGLVLRGLAADAATIVAIFLLLGAFWQHVAAKRS